MADFPRVEFAMPWETLTPDSLSRSLGSLPHGMDLIATAMAFAAKQSCDVTDPIRYSRLGGFDLIPHITEMD